MKRMLPALLTLLLVLAAVSHGTAAFCDITENKAMHQCSGALGQSIYIYPLSSNMEELLVFFNNKLFFVYREGRKPNTPCQNRCQVMSNGTLRLENLTENNFGMYFLQVFDSDGTSLLKRNITLSFQEHSNHIGIPVAVGTCLLLLALLLGTYYLYNKKRKEPKTSQTTAGDRPEEPQELVYCQVQVVKKEERPEKHKQEPQVVYGEVKVSS